MPGQKRKLWLSMYLTDEEHEWLSYLAREDDRSNTAYVRHIIRDKARAAGLVRKTPEEPEEVTPRARPDGTTGSS
jgi:hypothetical protein